MADPLPFPAGVSRTDSPNLSWQPRVPKIWKPGSPEFSKARKPVDLNEAIDRSVRQGGYWQRGVFTVPASTPEERVQLLGYKYLVKYRDRLEAKGLKVHRIVGPIVDKGPLPVEPDRRRYLVFAFVSCRPFQPIYVIPDKLVPEMQKAGLRLLE